MTENDCLRLTGATFKKKEKRANILALKELMT